MEEVFLKLESLGQVLRIDPANNPTMFHYAPISTGEVELLRTIKQVIRKGRVLNIGHNSMVMVMVMVMAQGEMAMEPVTLYVDCTVSAITSRTGGPVFRDDRFLIQILRAPLVALSAALTAYVEVRGGDEEQKNKLCTPVPFSENLAGYARATHASMMNQYHWSQDKADAEKWAVMARLRTNAMAAIVNMPKIMV